MWWYRRRVQRELQPIIGRAKYRESLNTPDIEVARTRAALRGAEFAVEFEAARAQIKQQQQAVPALPAQLTPEAKRYIAEAVRVHVLDEDEEVRKSRPSDHAMQAYESTRADQFEESAHALATGAWQGGPAAHPRPDAGHQSSCRARVASVGGGGFKATEGWNLALRDIRDRMSGEYVPTPLPPERPEGLRAEGFPTRTVDGIDYTGNRVADEDQQRALWDDELRTLFEGEAFAAIAADQTQEALYWLSAVLLFTGARPREVCQVDTQVDFGQSEGHWYIDLNEKSPAGKGVKKTIKTGEARRIPLHSELVRLGFPQYVERVREAGAHRLFPNWRVKPGNPYTAHSLPRPAPSGRPVHP